MTHEHGLGTVARLASRHFRLLPVLALVLTTSGALFAAAPVANDDVYGGQKGKTLTVDAANGVLANDTDADSDPITAILVDESAADAKGALTLNGDGSFEFIPDDNTTYITSFTYKANDGGADSNTVTVVISINNNGKLPEAPIASFSLDDATVTAGTTVNFDGSGSTLGDGASLDNFIWDYGEGGGTDDTGATDNTTHQYNTPGLFVASLTVKDDLPLTSETVFLPILVSDGTTGDGRMYVKKAQFAISWSKHAGGVDADKFKISGVWAPTGFPADLTGMDVVLAINGQDVGATATLDIKGKFASAKGSSPSLKVAFKAKNGAFSIAGSLLDLRGLLGVVDLSEPGTTLPVALNVQLNNIGSLDTPVGNAVLDTFYKSTKGKSAKASYTFAKNATPTGTFVSLKTSATENTATGDHKVTAAGVIAGDLGTNIEPNGDITINIGGAAQIVLQQSTDYTVAGSGVDTTITLVKGAVPELSKFTISNLKGKFQLATNELTGVGLDLAGAGGTANDLTITIVVPTASGDLTFITNVELLRKDINSTKWKR